MVDERPVLDDIDARPGSTTSLLRTVIGLSLRRLDGRVSSAALVALAGDLGIPASQARTAVARLKRKGLLLADPPGGYLLNPAALPMLERGDRRIFRVRQMELGDPWCLVSATIPESQRGLRHLLRTRLSFIGAGSVAPGLWIAPGHLDDEVVELVAEVGAEAFTTVFRADDPRPPDPLDEAIARWWDLAALRAEHERFQASADALDAGMPFAAYVRLVDSWRVLPYVDPGLPAALLPPDWPGRRSFELFAELSSRLAEPAWKRVLSAID